MPIPLPSHCKSCVLYPEHRAGLGFSNLEGSGTNGVLVVAEALGEYEEIDGLPLRPMAPAGSVFQKSLRWQGLDRSEFTLTNIVRCRPPKNWLDGAPFEREAIDHCRTYLDAVIKERKPKCILALGGIALRELTGLSGEKRTISHLRGFVLNSRYDIPLVATYHPSFIVRGASHLLGVVIRDVKLATRVAATGIPVEQVDYQLSPTPNEVRQWFNSLLPSDPISLDIETDMFEKDDVDFASNAKITQIQFSAKSGTAIVLPYISTYFDVIGEVLASANPKWTWNGRMFDVPILRAAGFEVNGEHHDLMLAWRHLQPDFDAESRLMSLQSCTSFYAPFFRPWKHESSIDLPLYGAKDADSTFRCGSGLMSDLQKRGLWRGYYEHKFRLKDVLDDLGKRGLPVDAQGQAEFRLEVMTESEKLSSELQQHIPSQLLDLHPKQGYKVIPKPIKELVASCIGQPIEQIVARVRSELNYDYRTFGVNGDSVERWCKALPFNPNSSQQLLRYIKHMNYKVPKKWGEDKETTGKDALEKLFHQTGDRVIGLVREVRKMNKLVSAFTTGNWRPADDGRVHPTFLFGTATGQLSCQRPNIQQFPVHGDLACKFKRMIRAESGHTFISLDFRSFHARSLGWISLDEDYYKLADFDVHSFVTAHFVRLPEAEHLLSLPDEQLRSALSKVKSQYKDIRDQKAKRAILGLGFHMGVNKLYMMNADSFNPTLDEVKLLAGKGWNSWNDERRQKYVNKFGLAEAKKLVALIQRLFPRAFSDFPRDIEDRIRRVTKCYLKSPAGSNRWFWDLNLEEAVAFLPANIAHAHIDDVALRLNDQGLLDKFQLVNWIHDSLLFHCPTDLVDECTSIVQREMSLPSEICENELGKFQCNVDAKVGVSLAEMKEVK
ncbi:MAG TPA: DNA polymerase [Pyrinomonadaceae bacterium]|nr:DNA polymerase [Pyrinomonadaceae bacterium]